ncbi:hypothetical protein MUK42_10025 [Musa troglodytarum]|uniref:Uncharacterized protein n=1 Tax=Musa troglodytarum TaxID=320322 RepID=A0A9E7G482_9LILI|nr:hypothetical protein MUK42_10025 [Musa troglodytarum]
MSGASSTSSFSCPDLSPGTLLSNGNRIFAGFALFSRCSISLTKSYGDFTGFHGFEGISLRFLDTSFDMTDMLVIGEKNEMKNGKKEPADADDEGELSDDNGEEYENPDTDNSKKNPGGA